MSTNLTKIKLRINTLLDIPDISKIKKLGYEPKISIKEGFLRTVKSYTPE